MIDPKREEAVWRRVTDAAGNDCGGKQTMEQSKLVELLTQELEDGCTYEALAYRTAGNVRQDLLQLARQERQHARKLESICYVLSGRKPCPDRIKPPCITCITEELRSRYHAEVQSEGTYLALSKQAGSFAHTFLALAQQEQQHSRKILQILQQCL